MTQTPMLKKKEIRHSWYILDATGKTLGRFAAEVAKILRGKHKPSFTPYEDCGDGVIVLNADKIKVTGNKEAAKIYRRYTGYMGGMRETTYRTMLARKPEYIIEHAVSGMMSKSRLGHQQVRRLRVFNGTEHQMEAQNPIVANI
ncbi:MAG: 50S ribosomal protein L13 [Parachlamydia sp.]|nr:50S ribosomal protein L13 [Parachlamydia sp.]